MTGAVLLGSLALQAQAATVSVSNHPMSLLSQAVTEAHPLPIKSYKLVMSAIMGVLVQVIKKPSKTASMWFGLVTL